MKQFILFFSVFLPFYTSATDLETKLLKLEERVGQLESQLQNKLEYCELRFQYDRTYSNNCPKKTFVNQTYLINGSNVLQVRCGYYQIKCFRSHPTKKLEEIEVPLKYVPGQF